MGQLDDAIREHLELKRRAGADPAEIARLEKDAFGPVRREAEASAAAASPAEEHPAPPFADEPVVPDGHDHLPPHGDPVVHHETVEYDVEQALAHEEPRDPEPPHGDELEPLIEAHPEPAGGEPDVLEETPEFLQETPEHDKLWFEQKPPRDFDFGG